VYQKENGIARGSKNLDKSTMIKLMSYLDISSKHDRIVKKEDVFIKGNSVLTGCPS